MDGDGAADFGLGLGLESRVHKLRGDTEYALQVTYETKEQVGELQQRLEAAEDAAATAMQRVDLLERRLEVGAGVAAGMVSALLLVGAAVGIRSCVQPPHPAAPQPAFPSPAVTGGTAGAGPGSPYGRGTEGGSAASPPQMQGAHMTRRPNYGTYAAHSAAAASASASAVSPSLSHVGVTGAVAALSHATSESAAESHG